MRPTDLGSNLSSESIQNKSCDLCKSCSKYQFYVQEFYGKSKKPFSTAEILEEIEKIENSETISDDTYISDVWDKWLKSEFHNKKGLMPSGPKKSALFIGTYGLSLQLLYQHVI
uniref:Uncharacterized protein LOC114331143 n=1 Tax=Diabrotica virgifera virgifera TaxID=50390 RepID=A0A6P7FTY4_DIAVI